MKNQIQEGTVLDLAAPYARLSGEMCKVGTQIAVCETDLNSGEVGAMKVAGLFEIVKLTADVVTPGAKLYWDDTNKRLTTTASTNQLAGKATADASGTAPKVKILLINV